MEAVLNFLILVQREIITVYIISSAVFPLSRFECPCNKLNLCFHSFNLHVFPRLLACQGPLRSLSRPPLSSSHLSLSHLLIAGHLLRARVFQQHCTSPASGWSSFHTWVQKIFTQSLNIPPTFPPQPSVEHPSPWRWWGGSCRARAIPSSFAAQAPTSSWSRVPTTDAPTTRSVTQTRHRWRTRGATCQMPTRSCLRGKVTWAVLHS